ncbi:MAG: VOC family protein [Nibricoccus sp.]
MKIHRLLLFLLILPALRAATPPLDFPPLVTPATTERLPGKFIWADLFTAKPETVVTFYTELFGWTSRTIPGGKHPYTLLMNGSRTVGGVAFRAAPDGSAVSARWVGYVSVADVDASLKRVKAAGGRTIVPAQKLPGRGVIALVADGEGCVLGLFNSWSGDPGKTVPGIGDWCAVQLFSHDPKTAIKFYGDAFDYKEAGDDTRTVRKDDYVLVRGDYSTVGVSPLPSGDSTVRTAWLGFVRVENVSDMLARAQKLGGHLILSPCRLEGGSEIAIVADPLGGAVGLYSFVE